MNKLSKNSKNEDIKNVLNSQLNTGKPVIFATETTSNPEYTSVYVAQKVDNVPARGTSSLINLYEEALGIKSSYSNVYRTIKTFPTKVIEGFKKQIEKDNVIGLTLDKAAIQIKEDTLKSYDNESQVLATVNGIKDVPLTKDGNPIYRHTELVLAEKQNHVIVTDFDQNKADFTASANEIFNSTELSLDSNLF